MTSVFEELEEYGKKVPNDHLSQLYYFVWKQECITRGYIGCIERAKRPHWEGVLQELGYQMYLIRSIRKAVRYQRNVDEKD